MKHQQQKMKHQHLDVHVHVHQDDEISHPRKRRPMHLLQGFRRAQGMCGYCGCPRRICCKPYCATRCVRRARASARHRTKGRGVIRGRAKTLCVHTALPSYFLYLLQNDLTAAREHFASRVSGRCPCAMADDSGGDSEKAFDFVMWHGLDNEVHQRRSPEFSICIARSRCTFTLNVS